MSYSQDIRFGAAVDQTTMELGSFLQLTLTVDGTQSADPVDLPDIEGVQSRYLGPSTHISIINGQSTQSIAFLYHLYPSKVGQFQIPAVNITISGQNYTTQPINFTVVNSLGPTSHGQGHAPPTAGSLQDRIFVVMGLEKSEFYINEQIPVTIKLLINNVAVGDIQYPKFEHVGFSVDEYQAHKRYEQVIAGIRYQIFEFKTFAYPTRTGDLTLGPTRQVCSIRFKKPRPRGRRNIFDDDFFGGFFETYSTRSVTLESDALAVKVLPLPEAGKPEGFTGAVGRFGFEATVSPREVRVGDPITVRITVFGEGNLKMVKMPSFPEGGKKLFKSYDPQISEEDGKKIFEQVVIPKTDKIESVSSIRLSYFDPQKKQYQTVTRGPFPLKVQKVEEGEGLKVVGLPRQGGPLIFEEEDLGRDIIFIKDRPGAFKSAGSRLYKNFLFLLSVALAIVVWLGCLAVYHITHKIKTDVRFARRLKAPRHAKKGLQEAKAYMNQGDQKQFYDTLFKTLQSYLGNRFHMPAGTITLETIRDVVKEKKLKETILEDIKIVFDECEVVRYASAQLDKDKVRDRYRQTEKIIDFFEREW